MTIKENEIRKMRRNITVSVRSAEQLEAVARAGFWGVDIPLAGYARREELLSGDYEKELLVQYRRINDLGLRVGQTHLTYWPAHIPPVGDGSFEALAEYLLPMLRKEIELTAQMGCRLAVMHPYFVQNGERAESRKGNLRLIDALLPTLEQNGVTLALENIYGHALSDAHHESAEDMLYYMEKFSSPNLGLCLDTGHARVRGQDPVAMVQAYGHYLKALHVHSSLYGKDTHMIPRASHADTTNWPAFCATLDEIGYVGNFNLEIRPSGALPPNAWESYYRLAYESAKSLV